MICDFPLDLLPIILIALFKIVSESAVSNGVRRIEALSGEAARHWLTAREDRLKEAAALLKAAPDDVPMRVAALVDLQKKLERELADAKRALALGGGSGSGPTVEDGDLTPSLKLRRKEVTRKHQGLLDSFYSEHY